MNLRINKTTQEIKELMDNSNSLIPLSNGSYLMMRPTISLGGDLVTLSTIRPGDVMLVSRELTGSIRVGDGEFILPLDINQVYSDLMDKFDCTDCGLSDVLDVVYVKELDQYFMARTTMNNTIKVSRHFNATNHPLVEEKLPEGVSVHIDEVDFEDVYAILSYKNVIRVCHNDEECMGDEVDELLKAAQEMVDKYVDPVELTENDELMELVNMELRSSSPSIIEHEDGTFSYVGRVAVGGEILDCPLFDVEDIVRGAHLEGVAGYVQFGYRDIFVPIEKFRVNDKCILMTDELLFVDEDDVEFALVHKFTDIHNVLVITYDGGSYPYYNIASEVNLVDGVEIYANDSELDWEYEDIVIIKDGTITHMDAVDPYDIECHMAQ